ncbi:MAG: DUF2244 domain-containing protein [Hyphomicrobium sp.]
MTDHDAEKQPASATQFVLHRHRSLSSRGFFILMTALSIVSFIAGVAFCMIGAWPVMGFFGLDVALIYWAFRANYRSGLGYEVIDINPDLLTLTRVQPDGTKETSEVNPYWARVSLTTDRPDGRTSLRIIAQGRELLLGKFLTDDERRDFALALSGALQDARVARF